MIKIYNLIMDSTKNPLSNIPDVNTRHMVMQILAWMWCIIFSLYLGSFLAHVALLGAIAITVGTFETAKRRPQYFGGLGRGRGGEHE